MKLQKQKSGKKIPFDIARRKIKCLGINLTKEVNACTQKTAVYEERN